MSEKNAKQFRPLQARDIMVKSSPLHKAYLAFCGDKKPTKRQARKFLQKFPQYRQVSVEVK